LTSALTVLIDTDVFSALYVAPDNATKRGLPVSHWLEVLAGRHVVISFQTRAEVMSGLRASNWSGRRINQAQEKLDSVQTVNVDEQVIEAFATLTADCRGSGHGLHHKIHTADRWVAASAIAKGFPLLAGDVIYSNAPGLTLLKAEWPG
jgi:predicted nucleic acid-binding protein